MNDELEHWKRRYMEMDVQRGNAFVERDNAVREIESLQARVARLTEALQLMLAATSELNVVIPVNDGLRLIATRNRGGGCVG